MKKVLVSAYVGFNNFGDELIFRVLSSHLKDKNYSVGVLCNRKKEVKEKYNVDTYYYKCPIDILKGIINCDILISGGGSLLQNKTSNFSLFYYLMIILIAKLLFKKVIIFSQGIEPIKGKIPELITKNILKLVDFISVRDEKSKNLLANLNIKSELTSDPAYSVIENVEISDKKDGLIVQLRSFLGVDDELLENLANCIEKYYIGKISVVSFQDEIDENTCIKFKNLLEKRKINIEYISNKSVDEIIELLNSAKYVISTRLHGLIVANVLKTKVFAFCYDEKIKTLTEELNLDNIDILNYSKSELDTKLKKFFEKDYIENKYREFSFDIIDKELER